MFGWLPWRRAHAETQAPTPEAQPGQIFVPAELAARVSEFPGAHLVETWRSSQWPEWAIVESPKITPCPVDGLAGGPCKLARTFDEMAAALSG